MEGFSINKIYKMSIILFKRIALFLSVKCCLCLFYHLFYVDTILWVLLNKSDVKHYIRVFSLPSINAIMSYQTRSNKVQGHNQS